jgi:hypothetical protein
MSTELLKEDGDERLGGGAVDHRPSMGMCWIRLQLLVETELSYSASLFSRPSLAGGKRRPR